MKHYCESAAAVLQQMESTAVCEIPFLAAAFGFTGISLIEYLIAIGLGLCVIPVVETVKFFQRRAAKN